jgi:glycosyltransferase involved in cell wall biosynthesis
VIVPVYNSARYVGDCLASLTSQDADDMEILCVDDGSTYDSMEIIERVRRRDPRVRAYANSHAGPGAARNAGLARASGRYVLFVDSDDALADGAVRTLGVSAERLATDVLYFGGETVYETPELEASFPKFKDVYRRKTGSTQVMTGPELLTRMQDAKDYKPSCVMQIYSRDFIERLGLRFQEGVVHEDAPFSFSAILGAERAAILDAPLYVRRVREGSVMTAARSFENVYGYYVAMREMLRTLASDEAARSLGEEEYLSAFKVIDRMNRLCARRYAETGEDEAAAGLAGVAFFDRALMDLTARPVWRNNILSEKNKELSGKNQTLRDRNRALREKLSAQRATISGLRKREKELERLKRSASYRLGRALTAIPGRIRRAFRKKRRSSD